MASSALVNAPTLHYVVAPAIVASSVQVGQPVVAPGQVEVVPQQVGSSATVGQPVVGQDQVLTPQQVASSVVVGQPLVSNAPPVVVPQIVASSAWVGEPTVGLARSTAVARPSFRTVEATVRLLAPGGKWIVVGTDLNRGIVHEDLTYSYRDGSPDTASFVLRLDPSRGRPDLAAFNKAVIEVGGIDVWSGRIREAPGQTGGAGDSIAFQGQGWRSHGDDDLIVQGWVKQNMQGAVDGRGIPGGPRNLTTWTSQSTLVIGDSISMGYGQAVTWQGSQSTGVRFDLGEHYDGAAHVQAEFWAENPNAFAAVYIRGHNEPWPDGLGVPGGEYVDFNGGTMFNLISADPDNPTLLGGVGVGGGKYRYVSIFLWTNPGGPGPTSTNHILHMKRLIIASDSDLVNITNGQSNLTASYLIEDLIDRRRMPLLLTDKSEVEDTTFTIPDFWPDRATPNDLMQAVNAYHDYLLGVDVDRRVFFRQRDTTPYMEVGPWAGAEFQDASASSGEDVHSKAIVQAMGVDGETHELVRWGADAAPDLTSVVDTGVVSNPGFEVNTTGWTALYGTITRTTSGTPYSGSAHGLLNADANALSGVQTQITGLEAGRVYQIRFRYKNAGGAPVPVLDVWAQVVDSLGRPLGKLARRDASAAPVYELGTIGFTTHETSAFLQVFAAVDAGLANTIYIDAVQCLQVETSVVDRNGFTKAVRMPLSAAVTDAAAEAVTDVWLRNHQTTPFRGGVTVVGQGGVRRTKGGASIPPHELPMHTDKLIRIATMEDPDTGAWGRVGQVRSATYTHRTGTCTLEIDNERQRVEALLERLAVVTGQVPG